MKTSIFRSSNLILGLIPVLLSMGCLKPPPELQGAQYFHGNGDVEVAWGLPELTSSISFPFYVMRKSDITDYEVVATIENVEAASHNYIDNVADELATGQKDFTYKLITQELIPAGVCAEKGDCTRYFIPLIFSSHEIILPYKDTDNDSVPDPYDNCAYWGNNPDQLDFDGDGFGDACDYTDYFGELAINYNSISAVEAQYSDLGGGIGGLKLKISFSGGTVKTLLNGQVLVPADPLSSITLIVNTANSFTYYRVELCKNLFLESNAHPTLRIPYEILHAYIYDPGGVHKADIVLDESFGGAGMAACSRY